MIDKIAARHGMVAVARVAGEDKRVPSWNKPFQGRNVEDITDFDTWPLLHTYAEVKSISDVDPWILQSLQEEVRHVLRDAAERKEIIWVRDNLYPIAGSTDSESINQQLALITLSRRSDLKLYAFRLYSQPVMFFAKPGWERSVFASTEADERLGRFATGLKKFLAKQRAN
jgi:hypothetical protein